MALGSYLRYSISPALEVHLLQTKLHALLPGAGLSPLLDLNKATLPPSNIVLCSAPSVPQPVFTMTEKAPTRAFS